MEDQTPTFQDKRENPLTTAGPQRKKHRSRSLVKYMALSNGENGVESLDAAGADAQTKQADERHQDPIDFLVCITLGVC